MYLIILNCLFWVFMKYFIINLGIRNILLLIWVSEIFIINLGIHEIFN